MAVSEFNPEDLGKAASNLERLQDYFDTHANWVAKEDAAEALGETHQAMTGLVQRVWSVLDRNGLAVSPPTLPAAAAHDHAGRLEVEKLQRMAAYLQELGMWFDSLGEAVVPPAGGKHLQQSYRSAAITARLLEVCLKRNRVTFTPMADPRPGQGAVAPGAQSAAADGKEADGPLTFNREARLVLVDDPAQPLVQEYHNQKELTPEAKKLIDGFITQNSVNLSQQQRNKLLAKVLNWIEATPEKCLLVLKIGDLHGHLELYPTYDPVKKKA